MRRALVVLLVVMLLCPGPALPAQAEPDLLSLIYLSPAPGARHISPTTSLAFRQGTPVDAGTLRPDIFLVSGSRSGQHTGDVRLSDDRLTVLFYPDEPFVFGETVSVAVGPGMFTATGDPIAGASYQFATLDRPMPRLASTLTTDAPAHDPFPEVKPAQLSRGYRTYPEFMNVMTSTVTTPAQGTADGYVFVTSMGLFPNPPASLFILDNNSEPVYIRPTPAGMITTDFKRQIVNGRPYLVYYVGAATIGWAAGTYYVMDPTYTVVDSWTISNGYGADLHDLQLLDNGHALLLSYTPIPVNLAPYGGPEDGIAIDIVIQEQDAAKNVVFEWHGSHHIPLSDTYTGLSTSPTDYIHTNAIEVDWDGNLLISSRHLNQITKINRQSGDVIWRLGGRRNDFTFTNDIGFTFQHDIRRLPNGRITLFDNGNQHNPPYSRAVEYELDEVTKTVTRTWEYVGAPSRFAPFMANAQRLSNGNTIIGWGALPHVTEVTAGGAKAFELDLGTLTYRAYRYTWDALPTEAPRAALAYSTDQTTATIYSAWNGATQISGYEIYAGPTAAAMTLITTTVRTGFETAATLTGLDPATCAFQVRPVHEGGQPTPFSNTVYRLDNAGCRALVHLYFFPFAVR